MRFSLSDWKAFVTTSMIYSRFYISSIYVFSKIGRIFQRNETSFWVYKSWDETFIRWWTCEVQERKYIVFLRDVGWRGRILEEPNKRLREFCFCLCSPAIIMSPTIVRTTQQTIYFFCFLIALFLEWCLFVLSFVPYSHYI